MELQRPKATPEPMEPDSAYKLVEQGIVQLGLLYGISGLKAITTPGEGWKCIKEEGGITVTIDPEQTVKGCQSRLTGEQPAVPSEIISLFIGSHEIGHANDFLDPTYNQLRTLSSPARNFFDGLMDDVVIDKRNRRVPLLDAHADAVYSAQIPQDLTDMPKHVQLMFALRLKTVMSKSNIQMDDSVKEVVDSLLEHEREGRIYNIPEVMANPRSTLRERRRIADTFIWPHFEALLEEDKQEQQDSTEEGQQSDVPGDFQDIYNKYEQSVGDSQSSDQAEENKEKPSAQEPGENSEEEGIGNNLGQHIAEAVKEAREEERAKNRTQAAPDSSEADTSEEEQLEAQISKMAGSIAKEMKLSEGDAESYARSLIRLAPIIKDVSEVFMKLAAPTDVIMSPRYQRSAHTEGVRLHPRAMANLALQMATDQEQPIWQTVTKQGRRQDIKFGGIDVDLLGDVSISMAGEEAQCAADTALCLIEGLQLARFRVARAAGQFHQPDVRTQIIAFGSSKEVLSPMSHTPTGEQKGKTYTNLLRPSSESTLVNSALLHVKEGATAEPQRDNIVIVISDGLFRDHDQAVKTVSEMPKGTYVAHLVIGGGADTFISENHEAINNPTLLPSRLHSILNNYIKSL